MSIECQWNNTDVLGGKPVTVALCTSHISHGLAWNWTRPLGWEVSNYPPEEWHSLLWVILGWCVRKFCIYVNLERCDLVQNVCWIQIKKYHKPRDEHSGLL